MTTYILHGGCTRKLNEFNHSFWEKIVERVPDGGTVLLVYFADTGAIGEKLEEHKAHLREAGKEKRFEFQVATEEGFLHEAKEADAIFFNGGSTKKLLEAMNAYKDLKDVFDGKTVAGSSAGAYMLANFGSSHEGEGGELHRGFGLVPVRVICHHESDEFPPTLDSVKKLENTVPELPLIVLRDCEWRAFPG